jgi:hypothetical protein
MKEHS